MMDIANVCRTCLKVSSAFTELTEAINNADENVLLLDALMACTPTKVMESDGLPQHVCEECKNILEVMYSFRSQVIKAEEELKKRVKTNELISIKVEPHDLQAEYKTEKYDYDQNFDYEEETSKPDCDNQLQCNKCNEVYFTEQEFMNHLLTHTNELTYQIHYDKHKSGEKPYKCELCHRKFKRESLLVSHMMVHSESVDVKTELDNNDVDCKYQCNECDIVFICQKSFSIHMRRHRGTRQKAVGYKCDVCNKEFKVKSLLKRHIKLHDEDKQYKCSYCPKSYTRHDQFLVHTNKHKGVKTNVCPYCSKAFIQLCNLEDHIRIHTGETPFLCSECGKGFKNRSNLRQHMLRHTGNKPFSCALCPKTFCSKGQMVRHMQTHEGSQPYKCDVCGSNFTKASSLKKHKLIHVGVKAFQCDACPMRFMLKEHLKRHYRIHTGEKPYRCKYCERSFTQSNDLAKHTRVHIGQNIYECTVCNMAFRLKSELNRHYPVHYSHSNNSDEAIHKPSSPELMKINLNDELSHVQTGHTENDNIVDSLVTDEDGNTITITFDNSSLNCNSKDAELDGTITISMSNDNS